MEQKYYLQKKDGTCLLGANGKPVLLTKEAAEKVAFIFEQLDKGPKIIPELEFDWSNYKYK